MAQGQAAPRSRLTLYVLAAVLALATFVLVRSRGALPRTGQQPTAQRGADSPVARRPAQTAPVALSSGAVTEPVSLRDRCDAWCEEFDAVHPDSRFCDRMVPCALPCIHGQRFMDVVYVWPRGAREKAE
jgi:hypothetical protein